MAAGAGRMMLTLGTTAGFHAGLASRLAEFIDRLKGKSGV